MRTLLELSQVTRRFYDATISDRTASMDEISAAMLFGDCSMMLSDCAVLAPNEETADELLDLAEMMAWVGSVGEPKAIADEIAEHGHAMRAMAALKADGRTLH